MVEDVDGNVFLDCAAGIAVNSTGHSHPEVVRAIVEQAQRYPAHVRHGLLLRAAGAPGGRSSSQAAPMPRARASRSSATRAPRPTRRPSSWRATQTKRRSTSSRFLGIVPRPHARRALAHVEQKPSSARGFGPRSRPASSTRRTPSCYRCPVGLTPGLAARPSASSSSRIRSSCTWCRPTKSRPCWSSRSRARAATSCRRSSSTSGCGRSRIEARHAAHRRRGAVGHGPHRQACSPSSTSASSPTSSRWPRASRRACRSVSTAARAERDGRGRQARTPARSAAIPCRARRRSPRSGCCRSGS